MASSEEDSRFQPVDLATDLRTYRPKYPLPPDLRDIPTEETFCAYCGVSYLILNEIKFLEEKSEKLKRELELVKQDTKVSLSVPCNGKHCSASFDEHQILEDIKHLKDEKVELIRRLDDANVKLICYEATEKQFVKEIAQSQ
ncbi:unnamed protein product [Heterobilharzia americana]|nr:unnamed protein product [Heterobilharzia americana]